MLFAVMTLSLKNICSNLIFRSFFHVVIFHYELLCELLQLQFQSKTKIPCYLLRNLGFSNILLWKPKDKLTKQTKVNMKVTFPVMSYLSSSGKKARKKIQAYMGFFFFFFFRLITAKISLIFTSLSAVQIYDFHIFTAV